VELLQTGLMGLLFGAAVAVKEDEVFDTAHQLRVGFFEGVGFFVVKPRQINVFPGQQFIDGLTRAVRM
jgi:hypothetical protein